MKAVIEGLTEEFFIKVDRVSRAASAATFSYSRRKVAIRADADDGRAEPAAAPGWQQEPPPSRLIERAGLLLEERHDGKNIARRHRPPLRRQRRAKSRLPPGNPG